MGVEDLQDLIGQTVKTSYGTGGKIVWVSDYYDDKRFTVNYTDPRDKRRCIINGIKDEGGRFITWNGDVITFSGSPAPRQYTLF